jgi:hypothetical protein
MSHTFTVAPLSVRVWGNRCATLEQEILSLAGSVDGQCLRGKRDERHMQARIDTKPHRPAIKSPWEQMYCRPCRFPHPGCLMGIRWGVFSAKSRTALKTGWLITAEVIALYLGVTQLRDQARGIASGRRPALPSSAEVWVRSQWQASMALTRFQILLTRGAKSCYQTRYDHQPFRGWSNIVCGIAGDQRELRRRRLP